MTERGSVPTQKLGSERRRWERLPIAIPVFVRGVDDRGKEFMEFTSALNISAGGALLAVRRYMKRSSRVTLEIPSAPLPQLEGAPQVVRNIRGEVVRVTHSDHGHLWALKFTRLLPELASNRTDRKSFSAE